MGERPALCPPKREAASALLSIDAATRASLELLRPRNEGAPTVFAAIDRTVTAAGARELMSRLVSPSADVELINRRLDAVAALIEDWALRERVRRDPQNRAGYEPGAVAAEIEARRPARSGRDPRRARHRGRAWPRSSPRRRRSPRIWRRSSAALAPFAHPGTRRGLQPSSPAR